MTATRIKSLEVTQSHEANTVHSAADYSQHAHHPL